MDAIKESAKQYGITTDAAARLYDNTPEIKDMHGNPVYGHEPVISNNTRYTKGKFNDPKYAVINPTEYINNIYKDDGGFKAVMDSKRQSQNFPKYDSIANDVYNKSNEFVNQNFDYSDVKKYNNRIEGKKPIDNVLIYTKGGNSFAGGFYPESKYIEISPQADPYVVEHEITHAAQNIPDYSGLFGGIKKTYDNWKGYNDYITERNEGKLDKYMAAPNELHANISSFLRQKRIEGIKLDTEESIDSFVKDFIKRSDEHELYGAEETALKFAIGHNKVIQKMIKEDKVPVADIIKALLMTTAKNEQQVPNQPNSPFTHGMDIS